MIHRFGTRVLHQENFRSCFPLFFHQIHLMSSLTNNGLWIATSDPIVDFILDKLCLSTINEIHFMRFTFSIIIMTETMIFYEIKIDNFCDFPFSVSHSLSLLTENFTFL